MSNQQTREQGLTEVSSSERDKLGSIRWDGGKCYKYVKLLNETATVAGAAGDAAAYDKEVGYANNTVVLDCTDADAAPLGAGILLAAVAGTAGTAYYVWLQIKGFANHLGTLTAADGQPLTKITTDLLLAGAAEADSTAVYKSVVGFALDASAKTMVCDFPF